MRVWVTTSRKLCSNTKRKWRVQHGSRRGSMNCSFKDNCHQPSSYKFILSRSWRSLFQNSLYATNIYRQPGRRLLWMSAVPPWASLQDWSTPVSVTGNMAALSSLPKSCPRLKRESPSLLRPYCLQDIVLSLQLGPSLLFCYWRLNQGCCTELYPQHISTF